MQSDVDVYGRMKGGIDIDRRKYLKVLDSRAGGGGACAGGARGNMEYIQPLCKSVRDSDFGVRHFSICNSGGPLKKPQEKTFSVTNGARNQ
jgi:hypothetical protein